MKPTVDSFVIVLFMPYIYNVCFIKNPRIIHFIFCLPEQFKANEMVTMLFGGLLSCIYRPAHTHTHKFKVP